METRKYTRRVAVACLRVSTREQGTSGLGLEAQRPAVDVFCESHGYQLTVTHQDIESGRNNALLGLAGALATAKTAGATLIIARLARLSGNASIIMVPLAQQEREMISTRTLTALAELKMRGLKQGSPEHLTDEARAKGRAARQATAQLYANGALTHTVAYKAAGWTLAKIAEQLSRSAEAVREAIHPDDRATTPQDGGSYEGGSIVTFQVVCEIGWTA